MTRRNLEPITASTSLRQSTDYSRHLRSVEPAPSWHRVESSIPVIMLLTRCLTSNQQLLGQAVDVHRTTHIGFSPSDPCDQCDDRPSLRYSRGLEVATNGACGTPIQRRWSFHYSAIMSAMSLVRVPRAPVRENRGKRQKPVLGTRPLLVCTRITV